MEEITSSIIQSGFSVGVACFLLVRMENKIAELSKAINQLVGIVSRCATGTAAR